MQKKDRNQSLSTWLHFDFLGFMLSDPLKMLNWAAKEISMSNFSVQAHLTEKVEAMYLRI